MDENSTILDKEAEELFKQLGGIEKRETLSIIGEIARAFQDEQARSDPWRILLVELVHEICAGFLHHKFFKERQTTEKHVHRIVETLKELCEMPDHDGQILIRYRGLHSSDIKPIELDYLISFGDLIISLESALTLARHHQDTHAHLHAHLIEALSVFRANSITTLFIRVPQSGQEDLEPLEPCIEILYQYYQALKEDSPTVLTREGNQIPLIYDQDDQPDPNLTMVAGLNSLDKTAMQTLVQEVDELLEKESEDIPLCDVTNAFNAIFSLERFKEKLVKPPIEVNNVKWLMLASDQEILQKQKMQLVNTVFEKFGGPSQEAVQIINTLYEGDFNSFSPYDIGLSLHKITGILQEVEARKKGKDVEDELLNNVEDRLEPVRDELLDDLIIKGDVIEATRPGEKPFSAKIHDKIIDLVKFFKGRSRTRKKLMAIMTESVAFDDYDYDIISRMFSISVGEAPRLVQNIEALFDKKGGFLKKAFEDRIPEFAKYGANIFFFLWVYLKEMSKKSDRIAFLNALQFLIPRLDRPEEGIKKLLEDFMSSSTEALPSDRNAIMLANILLRKENWEIGTEIEITPEEVLLVEDNINPEAIKATSETIAQGQDDFIRKVETIHTETKQWLWGFASEDEGLSVKYLLSLEREIYIFLSILDPPIAGHVLRNAIRAYGDPRGQVYGLKKSRENLNSLMTLLRVVVRALERVGTPEDLQYLRQIKEKQSEFARRKDEPYFLDMLTRIVHHCDKAVQAIEERAQQGSGPTT
ncbi:MAG: hypothetical protein JSV01_10435 [Desulfobacterales bacterium]|nr:MAG: hypothetical protein JSV01_10435 [Desulfobacterales bacterium]